MTRINTNVGSLIGQNTLGRSNASLNEALTRLSTGLRINTGKDDPAGLIASENLRSDITSIRKAISNTDRANQVIATADSALGQVSSLLNDIRGLVTESANTGALSQDQIDANQLQVDSSLEALNRIAQTTTFQGRELLDGSLDFITAAKTNFSKISGLSIDQANLGSTGKVSVDIDIATAASKAQVDITNVPAATAAANSAGDLSLSNTVVQGAGTFTFDTTNSGTVILTAKPAGDAAGAEGVGPKTIEIVQGAVEGTSYDTASDKLTITADVAGGTNTLTALAAVINAGTDFATGTITDGSDTIAATNVATGSLANGRDAGTATIAVTADNTGTTANGVTVTFSEDSSVTAGEVEASFNGTDIEIKVNDTAGSVSYNAIKNAIDGLSGYSATLSSASGDANYDVALDSAPGAATTLSSGISATGGLAKDEVIEIAGNNGAEVFNFKQGASIDTVAAAINLVSDATGAAAVVNGTTLEIVSTEYGSKSFIDVKVQTGGIGSTFQDAISDGSRDLGTDVVATVNGINATARGNSLSINTASLDLGFTVQSDFTGPLSFDITGGGALFQLGPNVVSNQQARIGIGSVNTARLGGVAGKLLSLGTGGTSDLNTDTATAAKIVEAAIDEVTGLRGRLGAFQRTTLETNKNALNDTLINLSEAESQIRDADFAVESAKLTRAQILVQSGTNVLGIANQNPQNVLSLLR